MSVKYASDFFDIESQVTECPPNPYASGYGRKIPTRYMVRLRPRKVLNTVTAELCGTVGVVVHGSWTSWRRVYCICFSNAGSVYVRVQGEELFLHDFDLMS